MKRFVHDDDDNEQLATLIQHARTHTEYVPVRNEA
jgi:hypothetical protein